MDITALLTVPRTILQIISALCDIYVYVAAKIFQQKLILSRQNLHISAVKSSHDYIIVDLISWLVRIDLLNGFTSSLSFATAAFNLPPLSSTMCVFAGMGSQFAGVWSPLWHIIIASYLFYLLTMTPNQTTKIEKFKHKYKRHNKHKSKKHINNKTNKFKHLQSIDSESYHKTHNNNYNGQRKREYLQNPFTYHMVKMSCVLFCFLATFVPLLIDDNCYDDYNTYYDPKTGKGYGYECWIVGYFEWIEYGLVIVSLMFHYIVLILAWFKYNETKSYTNAYIYLVNRLIAWVVVFSFIRLFPTIEIVWNVISVKTVPFWLVMLHHICTASVGIANAIVWYSNRRTNPNTGNMSGHGNGNLTNVNKLQQNAMVVEMTDNNNTGTGKHEKKNFKNKFIDNHGKNYDGYKVSDCGDTTPTLSTTMSTTNHNSGVKESVFGPSTQSLKEKLLKESEDNTAW